MKKMALKTKLSFCCIVMVSGLIEARDTRPLVPEYSVQFLDPVLIPQNQDENQQQAVNDAPEQADQDEQVAINGDIPLPNPEDFPVHYAAATGNLEEIEQLITAAQLTEQQVDFTALDDQNMTPMHYAAYFGQSEVIWRLNQINPHLIAIRAGMFQAGPLVYAVITPEIEAITVLITLGADPHERIIDINTPGNGPIFSLLRYANQHALTEVAEAFVRAGYQFRNDDDMIHGVADFLNVGLIRYLIEHNAPIDQHDAASGFLPIHYVVNPDQSIISSMDPDEVFARQVQLVQLFKSTIFAQTAGGRTVLHLAAQHGDIRLAEYLIQQSESMLEVLGSNSHTALVDIVDNDGNTPLHFAAAEVNQVEMIGFLVNEQGLDVNQQNSFGRTALHKAVARGYRDVITALIQLGASLDLQDAAGQTPLQVAMSFDQEHGIDPQSGESLTSLVLHEYGLRHPDRAMAMLVSAYNSLQTLGSVIAFYMLTMQHQGPVSKQ